MAAGDGPGEVGEPIPVQPSHARKCGGRWGGGLGKVGEFGEGGGVVRSLRSVSSARSRARGTKARWCEDGGQLRHEHSFTSAAPPAGRRILWHLIFTGAKMGS